MCETLFVFRQEGGVFRAIRPLECTVPDDPYRAHQICLVSHRWLKQAEAAKMYVGVYAIRSPSR